MNYKSRHHVFSSISVKRIFKQKFSFIFTVEENQLVDINFTIKIEEEEFK